jgi:phage terminase small subunit
MGGKKEEDGFTARERAFCQYYVATNRNGAKSARLAGYAPDNARYTARDLLTKSHIKNYINELLADQVMPVNEILAQLTMWANGSIGDVLDDTYQIDLRTADANDALRLIKKLTHNKDGSITVELYNARDATLDLAKYHKLFGDDDDWRKALEKLGYDAADLFKQLAVNLRQTATESAPEDDA